MTARIFVTGATGNVGSEVVRLLHQRGIPFRVGVREEAQSRPSATPFMEVVTFDFLKPETFSAAFDGIRALFLIRPPQLSNVERDIAPVIHAAIAAGVGHIVFLSLQGVEQNRMTPHHKIEQLILERGIAYTFLRAGFFMQNLSTTHAAEIREENQIVVPAGQSKTSFVDVRDIAAVAVCALTQDGHHHQSYTLTGAEALDYTQVAAKISTVLARPIRYANPSLLWFVRRQLKAGKSLVYAIVVAGLYTLTRFGNAKTVSADVERVLGRAPISFDQFALEYKQAWLP